MVKKGVVAQLSSVRVVLYGSKYDKLQAYRGKIELFNGIQVVV